MDPLLLCCQAQAFLVVSQILSEDFVVFLFRLCYICVETNCVVLKMLSHLCLQTEGRDCWCMQRRPVWTAHLELDPHIDEEMVTMTMLWMWKLCPDNNHYNYKLIAIMALILSSQLIVICMRIYPSWLHHSTLKIIG